MSRYILSDAPTSGRYTLEDDDEQKFDPLREVALQGRAAAQGVFNTLSFVPDALIGAQNAVFGGVNRVAGTNLPMAEPYSQTFSRAMDQAGAYRPESDNEQTRTRMTQGLTGALTGVGLGQGLLGGPWGATGEVLSMNPIQQTIAGAAAPLSGELARQSGAGPWGQMGAEALTAMLVPSDAGLRSVARARDVPGLLRQTGAGATAAPAGRAAQGVGEAVTEGGRENIVGRILREVSQDPDDALTNLQNRTQRIVAPTTAQASNDVGLLRAENVIGKTMDRTNRLGEQRMQANTQLQEAFEGLLPLTAAEAEAKRQTLNAAARTRLDRIFENRQPVAVDAPLARIDELLASPVGQRQEVRTALEYAKKRLTDDSLTAGGKVGADARSAYSVRQDITDYMNGRLKGAADRAGLELGTTRVSRLARGVLDDVVGQLDESIESVVPGYQAYLKRYGGAAQRIERREMIGEVRASASTTATDAAGEFALLSPAQMVRTIENRAKEVGTTLTPNQRMRLQSIAADLQRGAKAQTPVCRGGGPTP